MTHTSPAPPVPDRDDSRARRFELLISVLLRSGVAVSLALIVLGTVLTFVHHPDFVSSRTETALLIGDDAVFPHSVEETIRGLAALQGRAFVAAGLLVLIITPVMRVAVSVFAFAAQKDVVFTVITSVVLTLLLLSFALGRVEG